MNKLVYHALVEQDQETKDFVALCLELDIATQGVTPRDAVARLQQAVELYIQSVKERGDYAALFRPAPREEWEKLFAHNLQVELEPISAS